MKKTDKLANNVDGIIDQETETKTFILDSIRNQYDELPIRTKLISN